MKVSPPLQRWLPAILLLLAAILSLLRFTWLTADFPNHSPWMLDEAKYTDEGWWANGAVRHHLLGHWQVPGDYNPAAAVPIWPILLSALFHFTGVSILAARATTVLFSIATVALTSLLLRRCGTTHAEAALGALLLAASPFAFAFSRLATLDTTVVFEFCLLLWIASYTAPERPWLPYLVGLGTALTLLTKTTALFLVPGVLWMIVATGKRLRAPLLTLAVAGAAVALYIVLVLHSSYAVDYRYFFSVNAMADVDLSRSWYLLHKLLRNSLWIDRVLYPAAMAALIMSLTWLRQLWRKPLFAASWAAFAGEALFILRRQEDYAPRYFLVMLLPVILILVLALSELRSRSRTLTLLLGGTLAVALLADTAQILGFLDHREYRLAAAAKSIRSIVNADGKAYRLILGSSADQLALMTGIPAINDGYSSEDLAEKVARDQPGWYISWNSLDSDSVDALAAYHLDRVAAFGVFDHPERNLLILYRMVPVDPSK